MNLFCSQINQWMFLTNTEGRAALFEKAGIKLTFIDYLLLEQEFLCWNFR